MKQKLFALMSVAALLASCSNDDFLTQAPNEAPKSEGIVFKLVDEATTRGEFTTDESGKFATSWNAEMDRIGIIYSGAVKGKSTDISTASSDVWNGLAAAKRGTNTVASGSVDLAITDLGSGSPQFVNNLAIYKTTRSGSYGWVTAVNDDNMLKFANKAAAPANQVKASFRAFRPIVEVNGTSGAGTKVDYINSATGVETMNVTVDAFNTQNQVSEKANFDNFFMVANPINKIWSATNSVGEELALAFERPFSAMAICTKGYDKTVYGKLKSVTVKTESSNIACSAASKVDIAKKNSEGQWVITPGTGVNTVTLNIDNGNGIDWSDNYYAFIQILPVNRSGLGEAEKYEVKLTFAEGAITIKKSTTNNWAANSFVKVTCDLDDQNYLYLATGTTLVVNKAMPKLDSADQFDGVDATDVTNFVSKIVLSESEIKTLKEKFTGITDMTLANQAADLGNDLSKLAAGITSLTLTEATTAPVINTYAGLATIVAPKVTTVPAGAYKGNDVLTKVVIPAVESIGEEAFSGATGLDNIGCAKTNKLVIGTTDDDGVKSSSLTSTGAFAFNGIAMTSIDAPELTTVGGRAFGGSPLNSLTSVLLPKYDYAEVINYIALLNGTALTTADLSSVAELSAAGIAFTGKTALTTVILKEGAKIGNNSFSGCTALATVENLDKVGTIGESAFSGTALTKALINVETIGKNAFAGCTTLATLTLGANVKTIADGAFSGCSSLSTVNNLADVTAIGKEAFKGTAFSSFDFLNATLGEGAFQSAGLKGQVRSNVTVLEKNVFKGANTVSNFVFPNVTTIKEGALAGLLSTSPYATITFGAALTSIDAKAFCTPAGTKDGSSASNAITGTASYNLILTDKTGLTIKGNDVTYIASDGKYYKITFQSVQ